MIEDRGDARTGVWRHTINCRTHRDLACNCGLEGEMLERILELELEWRVNRHLRATSGHAEEL
jgi:hypothetical protein